MAAVLAAGALAMLSGCGGSGADRGAKAAPDPGPQHVHGLGINPADGSLVIATHTGLFRMAAGSQDATRVGDRRQDTMGFAVVGPDRFIGSGHPDPRDQLPPSLGLIESSDAGRSWASVSLLGETDFHTLRAAGARVVGYDASGGRLMTSADRGRTWRTAPSPPAALADVVVDPSDPTHLVAASAAGLITSSDAGERWSRPGPLAVALAWPAPTALYALAPDGAVSASADGGDTWVRRGELSGEPAALTATAADSLIVALHDGRVVSSADGGRSWSAGPWAG